MDKETADLLRGMVRLVSLKNTKDDGETQRASIEVADGVWRDDVDIMQPFGFASHVPEDGALGLAIAIGGDQGKIVVLPVGNPSKRMGGLNPGEVGVYNDQGDKTVLTSGGNMEIKAGAAVTVVAPTVIVDGDIECTGDISDKNGSMQEMRDRYNEHDHAGTPPPSPQMD